MESVSLQGSPVTVEGRLVSKLDLRLKNQAPVAPRECLPARPAELPLLVERLRGLQAMANSA